MQLYYVYLNVISKLLRLGLTSLLRDFKNVHYYIISPPALHLFVITLHI